MLKRINTQRYPDNPTLCGKFAGGATVTVWFQVAKVVLADGGYRTIPGTSTETTIELPAYRMATHLEQYVAQQYPGLNLVDWEIK